MGTIGKFCLSLLAATILLLGALPPATADAPACVPTNAGMGTCEFRDGEAQPGTYVYDTIIVPSDAAVSVNGPLNLQATSLIHVAGSIQTAPPTLPGAPGHTIRLASGRDVIVSGDVTASPGADAPTQELHLASGQGELGGTGGSIYVSAGVLAIFSLTGTMRAGDGGAGGEIRLILTESDVPTATLDATGGPGGQGGTISIDALTASIQGVLVVGNGGKGGVGYALAEPYTLAASPGGQVRATGGAGGPSGQINLPLGMTPMTLHDLGHLEGAIGGAGGDGYAYAFALPTGLYGAVGVDDTNDQRAVQCAGERCTGAGASADAGDGGPGILEGGKGGTAMALAGPGGLSTTGPAGSTLDCTYWGSGSSCYYFPGGQGGLGGDGGYAVARGGEGGTGLNRGGPGGNAVGVGGKGGRGGNGGQGGHGWVYNWNGVLDSDAAAKIGCLQGGAIACQTVTNGAGLFGVCAAPGPGGPGGFPGAGEAVPGRGGTNVALSRAPSGIESEYHSGYGLNGANGAPPYWWTAAKGDLCAGY